MKTIEYFFVTGNKGKFKEVRHIFNQYKCNNPSCTLDIKLKWYNADLEEIQGSPEDVIRAKYEGAYDLLNLNEDTKKPNHVNFFVEDISLSFNALGNFPSVYIKHALKEVGLHNLPKLLDSFEDKTATAQCLYAVFPSDRDTWLHSGVTQGRIVNPRSLTEESFGWDSIFEVSGPCGRTYAEMTFEEKNDLNNCVSHRAKALKTLLDSIHYRYSCY